MCAEMDRLLRKLGAEEGLKQKAEQICREGFIRDLERGRSMRSYIAAALYTAVRESRKPIPLREFLSKIQADTLKGDQISKYYRMFINELELALPAQSPFSYLSEIVQRVHGTDDLLARSEGLLQGVGKKCPPETSGKDPTAIAAAAIYLASFNSASPLYERILADASGISERRLRTSVKALRAAQNQLAQISI
jgi:transcription initiation factor TFIIB